MLFTTVTPLSGGCSNYHSYPGPTTSSPPTTTATTADNIVTEPFLQTESGNVLSWSEYSTEVDHQGGVTFTKTQGVGSVSTVLPKVTSVARSKDEKGVETCNEKYQPTCDNAIEQFGNPKQKLSSTVIKKALGRYSWPVGELQADWFAKRCKADISCDNWDKKDGITGKQIYDL